MALIHFRTRPYLKWYLLLLIGVVTITAYYLVYIPETVGRLNTMHIIPTKTRPTVDPGNLKEAKLTRSMRNKTLHKMCAGDPARDDVWRLAEPYTVFHQIIVDEQRKFLYCYVPKVACSNWKRVIKYIQGSLTDINTEGKMDHKKDLVFLDSFSREEIDIKLKTYYKFMFVRNPIARLVSAYRNKFRENIVSFHKRYGVPIIRKYRKNVKHSDVKGDDVTFEEFIRYLLDTDTSNMDMHWRPMNELCQPCAVNYDFIGSFEYLSVDANEVLKTIGAESDTFFPQRQRWYKPTTQQKISDEMSSVSLYYLQQLVEKYLVDFIMFGYPPPSLKPIVAGEEA